MKILTAAQVREADQATIQNEPISSLDLMERAATVCFHWLIQQEEIKLKKSGEPGCIRVFCGMGNNGGDGLVIARLLHQDQYPVEVYTAHFSDHPSEDFQANIERLSEVNLDVHEIRGEKDFPSIEPGDVLIDALFGSGLSRSVEGFTARLIDHLNEAPGGLRIAIDIPSGLFSEQNEDLHKRAIFRAHVTLSLELPKLSFMFPESHPFIGTVEIIPIGLDPYFLAQVPSLYALVNRNLVASMLPERPKFSHKGTFGHALLIAGSYGKMGAAVLATHAALRSGAGLLTVRAPACGYNILQSSCPEAMVDADEEERFLSERVSLKDYSAIGVGPGLGQDQKTEIVLKLLIQDAQVPLVFDADAINILAENKTWLEFLPKGCIFTPHPGEFKRLVGPWISDAERLEKQQQFARKYGAVVVLKGAQTSIASPDGRVWFNGNGNPGMAKGGSGDVLTGLMTGLLAQGMDPLAAAISGVYLHGLAGDFAAEKWGQEAMTAGSITEHLGLAFGFLKD